MAKRKKMEKGFLISQKAIDDKIYQTKWFCRLCGREFKLHQSKDAIGTCPHCDEEQECKLSQELIEFLKVLRDGPTKEIKKRLSKSGNWSYKKITTKA